MRGQDICRPVAWERIGPSVQRMGHYFAALPGWNVNTGELMDFLYRGREDPPFDNIIGTYLMTLRDALRPEWKILLNPGVHGWRLVPCAVVRPDPVPKVPTLEYDATARKDRAANG